MNNNHIVILNEAQTQKINQWIKRNNKIIKISFNHNKNISSITAQSMYKILNRIKCNFSDYANLVTSNNNANVIYSHNSNLNSHDVIINTNDLLKTKSENEDEIHSECEYEDLISTDTNDKNNFKNKYIIWEFLYILSLIFAFNFFFCIKTLYYFTNQFSLYLLYSLFFFFAYLANILHSILLFVTENANITTVHTRKHYANITLMIILFIAKYFLTTEKELEFINDNAIPIVIESLIEINEICLVVYEKIVFKIRNVNSYEVIENNFDE